MISLLAIILQTGTGTGTGSGGGGTDPLPTIGYGALGTVFVAAMFGFIWFKPAVEDLRTRLTKTEEQRDTLLSTVTTTLATKLDANTESNTALKPLLEDVVRALDRVEALEDEKPQPRRATGGRRT